MPNLSLPTADFVTSSLNGAMTAVSSSFTIGTGLNLPATNGILQIDYDSSIAVGVDFGPETITYTAYNSGTGAVTGVTRGQGGTTAVAHNNAASVQQGTTTIPWQNMAWQAWTPTLTVASGTAPTYVATFVNRYSQVGKTVTCRINWVNASGGTAGNGSNFIYFTLPVNAITDNNSYTMAYARYNNNAGATPSTVQISSATQAFFEITGTQQNNAARSIQATFSYEAA